MGRLKYFDIATCFVAFCFTQQLSAQTASSNPLNPPSAIVVNEAKSLVENMKNNQRGPYSRLRWFCADGSVQPPQAFACRERGGGRQHGEYSSDRQRLMSLGWPVGTIYAAMEWPEFWDAEHNQRRLRDLVLENFLVETQNGWVLEKAQHYRGRIQAEDEDDAGLQLLLRLLQKQNTDWLLDNYLLTREVVHTVPHGAQPDLTRTIRRAAQDIAEQESSFEQMRIEIHTRPSQQSAVRVKQWANKYQQQPSPKPELISAAQTLSEQLDLLYGATGRQHRLLQLQQQLSLQPVLKTLADSLGSLSNLSETEKAETIADVLIEIRQLFPELTAAQRLLLLDGIADLSMELRLIVESANPQSRKEFLQQAEWLIGASFGEGLLSTGEYTTLTNEVKKYLDIDSILPSDYIQLTHLLNLSSAWAIGSIRHTFAEALMRYGVLEPAANGFIDDVLRASSLLPFANVNKRLAYDAQQSFGIGKFVEQQSVPSLLVLNPGLSRGKLRFVSEEELQNHPEFNRTDIVVLPQTISELSPVAGVLTLGEGNLLSHVQLLARNFGIPNIALTPSAIPTLRKLDGESVVLVAGSDGSVALWRENQLSEGQLKLLAQTEAAEKLVVPPVDLSKQELIPIADLNKSLSGIAVGPKAANLGELNRLFPNRVAPAAAIPFGIFIEEVKRDNKTDWQQLATLYQRHRAREISDQELQQGLDQLRNNVSQFSISTKLQNQLNEIFDQQFGRDGEVGIFIRSDTNVEDLPGFTGAGLSETIPNLTQREAIFTAIPKVWASVLSPRAITWRSNLLQNPEKVFPSVLLMKAVPTTKSGVLITADLVWRQPGMTISTAWGVGGAVAGEAAETIVLFTESDQEQRLVSEAKTPYQRQLPLSGGVNWIPAPAGPVLTVNEKLQLRELVREVNSKLSPSIDADGKAMPWDIEFGFVNGELTLFQIRPLVERGQVRADRVVKLLLPKTNTGESIIPLNASPLQVNL